mgnify:CR=1 FL=1
MDVTKEMDVDVDVIQSSGLLFSSSAAVEIIQAVAVAVATVSAKLCRKCLTSCN